MKTVVSKNIDGFDVVIGFDSGVVDPVATREKVNELLSETDEYKLLSDVTNDYAEKTKTYMLLLYKRLKTNEEKAKLEKIQSELLELNKKIILLRSDLAKKMVELIEANKVYFTPKAGEVVVSDDEYSEYVSMVGGLEKDTVLTLEKKIIPDYRGQDYFLKIDGKWIKQRISKIGKPLPADGKTVDKLTNDDRKEIAKQDNEKRLAEMTREDKDKEKEAAIEQAGITAALKRSQLEIQGEPRESALRIAQEWFNTEKNKINHIYG